MKLSNKVISALRLPSNAHLHRVNCAFSGYASLEIPHVIQLLTKRECLKNLLDTPIAEITYITINNSPS